MIDPLEEASRLEREARDLMAQAFNLGERGAMHAATGLLRMAEQKAGRAYESVEGIRGSGRAAGDPDADRRAAQLGTLLQGIRQEILRLEMQGKGRGGADAAAAAASPDLLHLPRDPGFDDGAAPKPAPPGRAPGPTPTAAGTGTIEVQSLPLECTVNIPSAGVRDLRKTMAKVTLSNVPAGTHAASFSATGKTLTHSVVLNAGAVVRLFVDFPSGKVVETGAESMRGKADAPKALTLDLGGGVTMDLVLIPAGEFLMGSPASEPGRGRDETQHRVRITHPFYMGSREVTQAQYESVTGSNPSLRKGAGSPVESVSWNDTTEFCRKLSQRTGRKARLPTEAEWEYACRAGTTTAFHFGETPPVDEPGRDDERAHGRGPGSANRKKTNPGGSLQPNAWGLHDMHGNAWEWCADWYGEYPSNAVTDPAGPVSGSSRVCRGGCWGGIPWTSRAADRDTGSPTTRHDRIGFRVVVEP